MKIEPQKPKSTFNPLVLTLETPEEVAALFALVNHGSLAAAVEIDREGDTWYRQIKHANEAAGNPSIEYVGFHENLEQIIA